jgi:hypothetical protein
VHFVLLALAAAVRLAFFRNVYHLAYKQSNQIISTTSPESRTN